ncbi:hypothetical protein [Embleya sp. NPDC059237]|uniref:hypothetical protein n=1 Tax=Embleya sp. NPDC059237 TaxID=3346784 RepID=UPI0036C493E4
MLPFDTATRRAGLPSIAVHDGPRRTQRVIWAKPPSPAALALINELPLPNAVKRTA